MVIQWTDPAKNDLKLLYKYIASDSIYYAKETVEKIVNATISLNAFPKQGRIVPEFNNDSIREILLIPYRIIYESTMVGVFILTIVHMKKQIRKKFH